MWNATKKSCSALFWGFFEARKGWRKNGGQQTSFWSFLVSKLLTWNQTDKTHVEQTSRARTAPGAVIGPFTHPQDPNFVWSDFTLFDNGESRRSEEEEKHGEYLWGSQRRASGALRGTQTLFMLKGSHRCWTTGMMQLSHKLLFLKVSLHFGDSSLSSLPAELCFVIKKKKAEISKYYREKATFETLKVKKLHL